MSLIKSFTEKFGMTSNEEALNVLKMTCFSNGFTPFNRESVLVLIQKAMEMDLNPFSGDLYVIEQKDFAGLAQGYHAEVGMKGWIKIANRHKDYDGVEFETSDAFISLNSSLTYPDGSPVVITGATWVKARVFFKGIDRPFETIEYLDECFSSYSQAWAKNPKRRLRQVAFGQAVLLATHGKEQPNYISITNDDISEFDKFVDSLSFELLSEESLNTKKSNVTAYFKADVEAEKVFTPKAAEEAKAKIKAEDAAAKAKAEEAAVKAKAEEAAVKAKAEEAAVKAKAEDAAVKAKAEDAAAKAKAEDAAVKAKAEDAAAKAKAEEAAVKAKAEEAEAKLAKNKKNSEVILTSGRIAQSISGYLDEADHVAKDDSTNAERAVILSELLTEVDKSLFELDEKLEIATGDIASKIKSARNIFKNRAEKLKDVQSQAESKAKDEEEAAALKAETLSEDTIVEDEFVVNDKTSPAGNMSVDEYLNDIVGDHMRQEFRDTDFVLMLISDYLEDSTLISKDQLLRFITTLNVFDKQWSIQKLFENGLIDKEFVQEVLDLAA